MFPFVAGAGWVAWRVGFTLQESALMLGFGEAGIALTLALLAILGLRPTIAGGKGRVREPPYGLWVCAHCGLANEVGLGGCWNCHLARELQGPAPTHIPEGNRWRCSHCSVWNGVLRTGCWHCGLHREGPLPVPPDIEQPDRRL